MARLKIIVKTHRILTMLYIYYCRSFLL